MDPAALQIYLLVYGAPEAQAGALEALVEMGPPATRALAQEVQRLSSALDHRLGRLPRDLTRWCSEIGSPDAEIRAQAVRTLADAGDRSPTAFLTLLLSDPNSEVRRAAVRALAALADPGTASILASSLDDADPHIRALAIDALGRLGAVGSPFLIETLRDSEYDRIRRAAATALASIEDDEADRALIEGLSDIAFDVRVACSTALGHKQCGLAALPLADRLEDLPTVAEAAGEALARLGDTAVPILAKALDSGDIDSTARALRAVRPVAAGCSASALFPLWTRVRSLRWKLRGEARRLCVQAAEALEKHFDGSDLPLPSEPFRGLPIPAENRLDPTDLPRPAR